MPSEQCSDGIFPFIRQTALQQADKIGIRSNAVLITRIDFNLFYRFDELSIPDYSTLCRNRLAQDDTLSELPGLINRQLTEKSLKSAAVIATVNPAMCGQPIENQTTKPVKKYFI